MKPLSDSTGGLIRRGRKNSLLLPVHVNSEERPCEDKVDICNQKETPYQKLNPGGPLSGTYSL